MYYALGHSTLLAVIRGVSRSLEFRSCKISIETIGVAYRRTRRIPPFWLSGFRRIRPLNYRLGRKSITTPVLWAGRQ